MIILGVCKGKASYKILCMRHVVIIHVGNVYLAMVRIPLCKISPDEPSSQPVQFDFIDNWLHDWPGMVKMIVDTVSPKYKERNGGYTRIIKLGKIGARSAETARIELV